MGADNSKPVVTPTAVVTPTPAAPPAEGEKKKPCKACCACPETRKPRDECIARDGAENCADLIEAHRKCMKEMGFNI